jgi:hypothetical protein
MEAFDRNQKWPSTHPMAVKLTKRLAEMVALDDQPLRIVEDLGFQRLMATAAPQYSLPTRDHLTKKALPDLYAEMKSKVGAMISANHACGGRSAFTSDIWTSQADNSAFLSVTAHWVTETYERHAAVLSVMPFHERHDSGHIWSALLSIFEKWEISLKNVNCFVVDNASNFRKALKDADVVSVNCFAHTLQLVLDKPVLQHTGVSMILKECRKIIGHFSHSPAALQELRNHYAAELPGSQPESMPKPRQDVKTRWNSSLHMLQSMRPLRRALRAYSMNNEDFKTLQAFQWEIIDNVILLLTPFDEITKEVCSSNATLSLVLPAIHVLRAFLSSTNISGLDSLKTDLLNSLNARFTDLETSRAHLLSTTLDPRFKTSLFGNSMRKSARDILLDEVRFLQNT